MTHVIVGAGLAGARAAQELRDNGYDGPLVLLGAEGHLPYERPPLSKDYLQGHTARDDVFVHSSKWYAEHDIDVRTGAVVAAIDRHAAEVVLADGRTLGYTSLLLATGSTPRTLRVPGADLDGVLTLRTLDDSDRLRQVLQDASKIAVIGAGWIGLEVAAAARAAGLRVTVLEAGPAPLMAAVGPAIGEVFAALHRDHGVDLRVDAKVAEIAGKAGRVTGVRLDDGAVIDADAVVVGVGADPVTGLAEAAGLAVDNGIRVDEHLRTSDPHIYAAGDVANVDHPVLGHSLRVEHWATAQHSGPVAARAMLEPGAPSSVYDRLPYFFSDQYDLGMEYTGNVDPREPAELVVRGDLGRREFVAFWTVNGRVLAGMNVNIWDVADDIDRIVRRGTPLDPRHLTDPDIPLAEL